MQVKKYLKYAYLYHSLFYQLQEQEKVLLRDREKFNHIIDGTNRLIVSDNTKLSVLESRQAEMGKRKNNEIINRGNIKEFT